MIYRDMEEDYPKCKVELVRSCPTNTRPEETNLVDPMEECREVEVMRCHIMKRKVRRGRPQSSCSRLPSKLCVKRKCEEEQVKCYLTVKMVKEVRPEEECKIRQRRICEQREEAACRERRRKMVCGEEGQHRERIQSVCGDSTDCAP